MSNCTLNFIKFRRAGRHGAQAEDQDESSERRHEGTSAQMWCEGSSGAPVPRGPWRRNHPGGSRAGLSENLSGSIPTVPGDGWALVSTMVILGTRCF